MSLLYPFTSSFFSLLICYQLLFCLFVQKEKRAEIQRPKMTLNPLKGSTQISVWKCQLSQSPPFPLLHAWDLFLSSILAFIFFQLRAVDSSDTVIQLYCGAATVAAVLCEGFSHVRREGNKQGVTPWPRCWAAPLQAKDMAVPCCATWQL